LGEIAARIPQDTGQRDMLVKQLDVIVLVILAKCLLRYAGLLLEQADDFEDGGFPRGL
jgi:hypothetical protein